MTVSYHATPEKQNSFLRLVGEESPVYDAPSPARQNGFVMFQRTWYRLLEGDGDAQAVLLALMDHANQDGKCWPSVATISRLSGLSDRQVRMKINKLVDLKIVTKELLRNGGVNVYTLNDPGTECRTPGTTYRTPRHTVPTPPASHADRTITSEPITSELIVTPISPPEKRQTKVQYTEDYKAFIKAYPANGRGSFPDGFKLWLKMDEDERAEAMAAIPKFMAGRDWQEGYQPGPEVWLRARKWENPPAPHKSPLNGEHPNAARRGKWVG